VWDELSESQQCDACRKHKAQVETTGSTVEEWVVRRRAGNGVEDVDQWVAYVDAFSVERLCFACYIARHGCEQLDPLGIAGWVDEPSNDKPDPQWPPERVSEWARERTANRDRQELRELAWRMRDVDMFADPPDKVDDTGRG